MSTVYSREAIAASAKRAAEQQAGEGANPFPAGDAAHAVWLLEYRKWAYPCAVEVEGA